ncbi:hypothetical protein KWH47_16830 [Xanthomonas campestris pv. spermacoces]|uniref:hypothetical protein n=1 Tax=Xanthomonas euvesicatoria TaxID=456327 RepID=UPI001C447BF4|nr:hypothetical protein [Xanthomonas euvesicatoria]MBV6889203.1 hypothetical protein [Xanthomonas campestris pv. spermacoces]
MLAQDSYEYIRIGLAIRLLRHITTKQSVRLVLDVERDLTAALGDANFVVSLAATESTSYAQLKNDLEQLDVSSKVTDELCKKISEEIKDLENIVFAEAITKKVYVLPDRRFNTQFLLSKPERLLKVGVFEKLEEIARIDFSSACRCILFGEATAAAFHILRATESVLKSYYFHHRRQNRLTKPMWASMVDQLKAKKRNKPPVGLLSSLDLIRTQYRNPTNHPEALYQIDSAQDLFGVCLDVIGKMTTEL